MPGRKWRIALEAITMHAADTSLMDQAGGSWGYARGCALDEVIEHVFITANYQGVSDTAARVWLSKNGVPDFDVLKEALCADTCEHLSSLNALASCGYKKRQNTCARVKRLDQCIVPRLLTRRGLFAQMAVGLTMWAHEHAGMTIVDWGLNALVLKNGSSRSASDHLADDLARIPGISVKVARMILADLMLGVAKGDQRLVSIAAETVVVDRVVHNLLRRTGALAHAGKPHPFGEGCYKPGGCADLIFEVSKRIDARQFDDRWPAFSPRLVQHALWRFGAADQLRTCNSNQIPTGQRCGLSGCPAKGSCARLAIG